MTPRSILLELDDGSLVETPVVLDGTGWYARFDDTLIHVSLVSSRPRAVSPAKWCAAETR